MSYTVGSTRVINTTSASGTTDFTFTFPYIKEDHIEVYKEYVKLSQGTGVSEYQVITNVSPKLIRLNTGTASANVRIEIRRNSSLDTPLVDYADGSTLTANDLDTSALQSLYIDQELKDSQFQTVSTSATTGHPTLNNNLLTEVADPINAQDAATKNYVATALKTDVSGGNGVSIADDQPLTGQIRVDLDANIATLRNMQTGASAKLAELTETELSILDEATVTTAELNTLDGITSDVNELNMLDGKSFRNSDGGAQLDTTSDTEIPSSKVIAAHVASSQLAIGGFITIADELSFPTTANMPKNGVVVSINNADGVIVNSSGVSVSGRTTDGTPATVTINGFPSSLYGETLAASTGLIVTATSTTNTYNYHKLLATESDIKQLSDTINDFHSRYRIASSDPVGTTAEPNDDGDLYWNTATNTMRVYEAANNAGWRDLVTAGETTINGISASTNTGGNSSVFNGVNNNGTVTGAYRFQLNNVPSNAKASQFLVSIDGTIQQPDNGTYGTGESNVANQPPNGFSITGNDIIFASPPLTNSPYFIITLGSALTIGEPSDNTVTSAKIVDGSIVNADINASADIDGSKIANDTISEVKLNSATSATENAAAGQVLKADGSGGASWGADNNTEYSTFNTTTDGLVPKADATGDTDKFLKGDGNWASPMVLLNTVTIGSNSSYTTTLGTDWWDKYKYIKMIYFGTGFYAAGQATEASLKFRYNSVDTANAYENFRISLHTSSDVAYNDESYGVLGYEISNGAKQHIECDIFCDGTNTSFKITKLGSSSGRNGIFHTFIQTAGSNFEFRQTSTNSNTGERKYFPGTAKFYGIN